MATDERPVITCAGNQSLFATVHPFMVEALSMQKTDWQRSYGRPVKKVRMSGHFVPFDVHQVPRKFDENRLMKDPVLHLYWIDCDIDTYKKKVRDDVFMWQSALKALSIPDWLIIVVVHDENKVKTKILRTSVYDKVKNEFGSRNSNRVVLFSEPFRNDPKSEAWAIVISRMQELMLASFSRIIAKFEDAMRLERERRTEPDWTFTKYFMLQESLAKFYHSIELYEDALVQYDELDALFAQFIVNHSVGARADWLIPYSELSSGWEGVSMSTDVNMYRRMLISEGKPSLLDLRNYMYSQQCQLLIQLERPSELTSRSLKFIHNTIHELRLLEVMMPPGAVSCWVFLTCKELLAVCEAFKESLGMEVYSIYTSHLWTCLQSVTHKLGCLCGLMPGSEPTSEELHSVVQLISGISNSARSKHNNELSPQDRLKRVLSSPTEFCDYYVELTELTVGTLKYIGHTRMAKILGQQLAKFYMLSGQPQQAEPFLLNCLQLFSNDQWTSLELDTWSQLAVCEQMIGNHAAYIRACLKVSSHSKASREQRLEFLERITQFTSPTEEPITVVEDCALSAKSIKVAYDSSTKIATIALQLEFKLPTYLDYSTLSLLIKPDGGQTMDDKPTKGQKSNGSVFQFVPLISYSDTDEAGETRVGLTYANTHSLLTLKDSTNTGHMIRNLSKNNVELGQEEEELAANLQSGRLESGVHTLTFILEDPVMGQFKVEQIRVQRSNIDLFVKLVNCRFSIQGSEPPTVTISSESDSCFMGLCNSLQVATSGGQRYKKPVVTSAQARVSAAESQVTSENALVNSEQALVKLEDSQANNFDDTFRIHLTPVSDIVHPGSQSIKVNFSFADAQSCDGSSAPHLISQSIECQCPVEIKSKLFTARQEKFIQITVFSLVQETQLQVQSPSLHTKGNFSDDGIVLTNLNGPGDALWRLSHSSQLSFLWRLDLTDFNSSDSIKCGFSLKFRETPTDTSLSSEFSSFFTDLSVDVVKTQFIVTRYIKSGIPMSPLSLSRQSSQEHFLSSSPESVSSQSVPNTWQALCECEMVVELQACNNLDLADEEGQGRKISYEIRADPNWAISGDKHGLLEITNEILLSSFGVKLMPLTSGHLCMPEVRLRNVYDEEYLPGQVYDNSKLTQVFINSPEE